MNLAKLIKIALIVFLAQVFLTPFSWANEVRDAVVKVYVTSNRMDYYRPWQSLGSESTTGSGCVIAGNRILTNAHVISDHTFIQVRKESDPKKFIAKVTAIGHDCDLSILTVEDPDFFNGIPSLKFGELPQLQDTVTVIGFPMGGDKLSITEGVVSRIEIVSYIQSLKKLLAVQIDAAINPGNSGGPVLQNGKLVGIAMQGISSSQNIGYMIPIPIISHFLKDLEDGRYEGFPIVGIDSQNTENKALRSFYEIADLEGGVLATRILPFSSADDHIKEGDVILEIDDIAIAVDGTFEFRKNERLSASYLISDKQIGENIKVKLNRKGKILAETFSLIQYGGLVPEPHYFEKPPYYIYGGLIFTVLSTDLLQSWGNEWWKKAPLDFVSFLMGSKRLNEKRKKEIVVLLEVLPDDMNIGYHELQSQVITKINGQEFDSFKDFVTLIENNHDDYIIFETELKMPIILKNADIAQTTKNILERNNIPYQYSKDVAEWLGTSWGKD